MGWQCRRALQHVGGDDGVALHPMPLAGVERPRLVQDADRHRRLANIVEQAGLGHHLGVLPAHAVGEREGGEMVRHPQRVGEGVVVVPPK
jgi:hypothetical protein